jgi:3'-phosphoadenosine 5'-phosphosulfate sulfotransferase (PAPS reductase)/FAD synthetase
VTGTRRPVAPPPLPHRQGRVDPRRYDLIVVNTSAGKDSQAMMDLICPLTRRAGVLDRVVALHCNLGDMEWPGTVELAAAHAAHYDVRFEVRSPSFDGDLFDHIERRGMWPSAQQRYCTSDAKRGPKHRLFTELVRELDLDRPVRILDCTGERAAESTARANKAGFEFNARASTHTTRSVWTWRPIHGWSTRTVWQRILASGVPYHWAYDQGMTRLSCSLCVLGSRADLIRGCQLRPDLAQRAAGMEQRMGHTFRADASITDFIAAATTAPTPAHPADLALAR